MSFGFSKLKNNYGKQWKKSESENHLDENLEKKKE